VQVYNQAVRPVTENKQNRERERERERENFETDSQEGPFIFLLTRKSSKALYMVIWSVHYFLGTVSLK